MTVLPILNRRRAVTCVAAMPNKDIVTDLLARYPIISDQVDRTEMAVILGLLAKQLQVEPRSSAVVEFGCYIGTTSLFIRRMLDTYDPSIAFHVYDSFSGLPEKTAHDQSPAGEQFQAGELSISRKQFELQFKKAGLKVPVIHKGWFSDISPDAVPGDICFAYLDGDYYESIRDSLRLIWPKLAPQATIVVDDYANEALPGAAKAVDEWLNAHSASVRVQSSLGIIQRTGTYSNTKP
jgi:O-methyltransferase